jgi:hypothetical protein
MLELLAAEAPEPGPPAPTVTVYVCAVTAWLLVPFARRPPAPPPELSPPPAPPPATTKYSMVLLSAEPDPTLLTVNEPDPLKVAIL